jgi:hypothetical protein
MQELLRLPQSDLGNLFPSLVRGQNFSDATWDFLEASAKEKRAAGIGIDLEPEHSLNNFTLDAVLDDLGEDDRDVRRRLLGYSRWYDPAIKTDMFQKLAEFGHEKELVESNAQRLHEAHLIKITNNYYLPMDEEVCQQAAESLMTEFLNELGE